VEGARWSGAARPLRIQIALSPSQPDDHVTPLPAVAVTATTGVLRGVVRVRANQSYTDAARSAGMRPFILPVLAPEDADAMLEGMQGLILTGGEDVDPAHFGAPPDPKLGVVHAGRDAFEIALVHAAQRRRLPTLAICRGIQVANVALGGTLIQDIPSARPDALAHESGLARSARAHAVSVTAGSRLARALGAESLTVNSFHHQSLDRVAEGLDVAALAPDGIIEGVEWTRDDWWMLGVQWHPEELVGTPEPWDRALFASLASNIDPR